MLKQLVLTALKRWKAIGLSLLWNTTTSLTTSCGVIWKFFWTYWNMWRSRDSVCFEDTGWVNGRWAVTLKRLWRGEDKYNCLWGPISGGQAAKWPRTPGHLQILHFTVFPIKDPLGKKGAEACSGWIGEQDLHLGMSANNPSLRVYVILIFPCTIFYLYHILSITVLITSELQTSIQ